MKKTLLFLFIVVMIPACEPARWIGCDPSIATPDTSRASIEKTATIPLGVK